MKADVLFRFGSLFLCIAFLCSCKTASTVYSNISVPEEGGINFVQLTDETDIVLGPTVQTYGKKTIHWWANPMLALSPDGEKIAYLARKKVSSTDYTDNIMVKNTGKPGGAVQRTFRNNINDLSWSPDGEWLCFSETRSNKSSIYMVNAIEGTVLQQISTDIANDYNPVFSSDCNLIYFTRADSYGYSIWSFNRLNNQFSNYSNGLNPIPVKGEEGALLCTRITGEGDREIWKINYITGVEQVILSQPNKSFTNPQLSPDMQWIVCVANTTGGLKQNLDIYAVRSDGTQLTQLTYHPGSDASPVWSPDGKSLYFLSQRGTLKGKYNIWKMNFPL